MQRDEQPCEEFFTRVTARLLRSLEMKVKTKRLDSTHVLSDMVVMGRA
jgi:hypothetical protein